MPGSGLPSEGEGGPYGSFPTESPGCRCDAKLFVSRERAVNRSLFQGMTTFNRRIQASVILKCASVYQQWVKRGGSQVHPRSGDCLRGESL